MVPMLGLVCHLWYLFWRAHASLNRKKTSFSTINYKTARRNLCPSISVYTTISQEDNSTTLTTYYYYCGLVINVSFAKSLASFTYWYSLLISRQVDSSDISRWTSVVYGYTNLSLDYWFQISESESSFNKKTHPLDKMYFYCKGWRGEFWLSRMRQSIQLDFW